MNHAALDTLAHAPRTIAHVGPPRARIAIATFVFDYTALRVAMALEHLGCDVQRWMLPDFPTRQSLSYSISNQDAAQIHADGVEIQRNLNALDCVWYRRLSTPWIDTDALHPDDVRAAQGESTRFLNSILPLVAPTARHINARAATAAADNKLNQLRVARSVGLSIPDTLVSNDPSRIRAFLRAHARHGAIHKNLQTQQWLGETALVSFTAPIAEHDLPEDAVLRTVPAIFQSAIPKAYEVRATFFGDDYLAARIDASEDAIGADDWRGADPSNSTWRAHRLPEPVVERLRECMRALGIVFGSIDLIVTPTGDHVFLEINTQGQFLFVEKNTRGELPMLDHICRFLVEGTGFASRRRSFELLALEDAQFDEVRWRDTLQRDHDLHVIDTRFGHTRLG